MDTKIIFLVLSVILFYIDAFLVFGVWFRGKRNAYLKTFFAIGLIISTWALFNGICTLLSEELYQQIYPYYFILGCIISPVFLLYILHFTESRLARSRVLIAIITITAAADVLVLLTNPWHHAFITGYNGMLPVGGSWFLFHALISYVPLIFSIVLLFRYIIRNIRKIPMLSMVGFAVILPIIFNVLYTFDILNFGFDITPFAFLLMFILFSIYSTKLKLFDNRNIALTSLFNTFSDAFLIVDQTNCVTDANPSFRKAFSELTLEFDKTTVEDVINFFESVVIEQNPADTIKRFGASADEIHSAEITLMADDTPCYYVVSKNNIYAHTQYVGFIISLIDVSNNQRTKQMIDEIKEKNKSLQELNDLAESASRAKGDFLSNMSHEMRTPMNAIIGITTMGKRADNIKDKDNALNKIGDAASHLLGVINDVLDMAKIEADKLELVPVEFNLEKLLQKVATVINFKIDEKRQQFSVNVENNVPRFIVGDDQRLTQVITNLLSNATKFTPEGGNVSIKVSLAGETDESCELRIEVEDSGIGISPEQQGKLFRAFEQAESGTSRKYGGTGLGLVISKRIVELMGGNIWIESELGKGSRFIFTIKARRGSKSSGIVLPDGINWKSVRIMVVDDMIGVRRQFQDLFNHLEVKCDTAADGFEACRMIEENGGYDIYFVDWSMPGMDGIELTKHIKSWDKEDKQPVVIMITAMDWDEIRNDANHAGVDTHLLKPLFSSTIIDCINECLGVGGSDSNIGQAIADTGGFKGKRLLLAEDIEINREILMALLDGTEIMIDCAEDGQEALNMIEAAPDKYDIVFMDMQMPRMDGLEATRRIRALPSQSRQCERLPIVAMTANVFKNDIEACLEAGMDDHIGKPLDIDRVLDKLRKYLHTANN